MISQYKRATAIVAFSALFLIFAAGCSKNIESPSSPEKPVSNNAASAAAVNTNTANTSTVNISIQNDSNEALLADMMKLAKQGKIINSEFEVKSTVIESIEKKLGKPDKVDWIPSAKGNYATYSRNNVVFGFNKGSQIFEVRSLDSRLKNLTLNMVKKAYGTPAYDVKSNGEEIIGYTAGQEYKMLLVFSQAVKNNGDPVLDHYSVLYPKGTVNNMANDPGREW